MLWAFRACCCIMGNQDIDLFKWWTCSYNLFDLIVYPCFVLSYRTEKKFLFIAYTFSNIQRRISNAFYLCCDSDT